MATKGGPNIITDGLVLYLDATNPKSYPGSGTTWFDLTGNRNANLFNGVSFEQDKINSLKFDGINDRARLSKYRNRTPKSKTISALFKCTGLNSTSIQGIFGIMGDSGNNNGQTRIVLSTNNGLTLSGTSLLNNSTSISTSIEYDKKYIVTYVEDFEGGEATLYVNNNIKITESLTGTLYQHISRVTDFGNN